MRWSVQWKIQCLILALIADFLASGGWCDSGSESFQCVQNRRIQPGLQWNICDIGDYQREVMSGSCWSCWRTGRFCSSTDLCVELLPRCRASWILQVSLNDRCWAASWWLCPLVVSPSFSIALGWSVLFNVITLQQTVCLIWGQGRSVVVQFRCCTHLERQECWTFLRQCGQKAA